MPSASVLVPIYNVEKYLPACLESLRAQQGDFEFLCLDDGSTDGSARIAEEFAEKDGRFRLIRKANSGYGDTLNRGLAEARGEYVGILESDDVMYPDALEALLRAARDVRADLAKGTYSLWWSEDGRDVVQHEVPQQLLGKELRPREHDFCYLLKPTDWSCVYRAEWLSREGIRFLPTPGAAFQDTSFMFKALCSTDRAVFLDVPIVHYRQDNEGSSINSESKAYAVCGEYDEIERWLALHANDAFAARMRLGFQVSKLNAYLWNLDRLGDDLAPEFAHRIASEFSAYASRGEIDWPAWDAWKATNLRAILRDPEHYLDVRRRYHGPGAAAKARFALHLAGPAGLAQALGGRRG